MENDFVLVQNLENKIDELDNNINDLSCANIVNNASKNKVENDIKEINQEINRINKMNRERTHIRNIKIFEKLLIIVLTVTLGISIPICLSKVIFNDIPLYRQDEVRTKHYEETIDNLGNTSLDSWYSEEGNDYDWIYVYEKWGTNYWGVPDRSATKYPINDYPKENIQELLNNPEKIKELYNYYRVNLYEQKAEITEEEKNLEGYIKAVYHYIDENDYIIVPQDEDENFKQFAFFLMFFTVSSLITMASIYSMDYHEYKKKLMEYYKKVDINDMKRQFKEKRMAYEAYKGNKPIDIDNIINRKVLTK